jgi:dihydrofolate reductase
MGGADVIRQALAGGHVEGLTLSIAPVIIGSGKRLSGKTLFEGFHQTVGLEQVSAVQSPWVTHLRYRVLPA